MLGGINIQDALPQVATGIEMKFHLFFFLISKNKSFDMFNCIHVEHST